MPAASGNPAPTYAVQGSLPTGLAFATGTRVLSGTPTTAGSGTITIRASNSQGNDDWTVDYTTTAASTDANLSALTVSEGTLTPAFAAHTMVYTVSVANSISSITVGATAADANDTIEGEVDVVVIADRPLVHLIAPINGVDFAVDEGSISHTEVTTVGVEGAAARITLVGDDAVVSSLRLRGHIVATGEAEERTDATLDHRPRALSIPPAVRGVHQARPTAGDLADDIIAYSDDPRESWDVILDGDRSDENMDAALLSEIRGRGACCD